MLNWNRDHDKIQDEKETINSNETAQMKDFVLGLEIINKNDTCCDCNAKDPTWAIISHGVLVWYVL